MAERNRAAPHPADRTGPFESELAKLLSSDTARHGGTAPGLALLQETGVDGAAVAGERPLQLLLLHEEIGNLLHERLDRAAQPCL